MSALPVTDSDVSGDDLLRALMDSCRRGNQGALAALFDRTAVAALTVARCVTADESAAEQAAHDAYLEIWQRARADRVPDEDLALWVLGVVHRHALAGRTAGAA